MDGGADGIGCDGSGFLRGLPRFLLGISLTGSKDDDDEGTGLIWWLFDELPLYWISIDGWLTIVSLRVAVDGMPDDWLLDD